MLSRRQRPGQNHVDRVALERGRVVGVGDDLHGRVLVAEQRLAAWS